MVSNISEIFIIITMAALTGLGIFFLIALLGIASSVSTLTMSNIYELYALITAT